MTLCFITRAKALRGAHRSRSAAKTRRIAANIAKLPELVRRLSEHRVREVFADFEQIRENPSGGVSPLVTPCSPKAPFAHTAGSNRQSLTKHHPKQEARHEGSRSVSAICSRGRALVLQSNKPRRERSSDGACLHMGASGHSLAALPIIKGACPLISL
jgi:hypothetical protein